MSARQNLWRNAQRSAWRRRREGGGRQMALANKYGGHDDGTDDGRVKDTLYGTAEVAFSGPTGARALRWRASQRLLSGYRRSAN